MVACLSLALFTLSGCGDPDAAVGPLPDPAAAVVDSGQVTDLEVAAATDSSVTLGWTEVDDGSGRPAQYRLKYALPPIDWRSATVGCDRTLQGVRIGARMSCTVQGLAAGTEYEFQLMSYRTRNGSWVGAVYSNVARGSTAAPTPPAAPAAVTDLVVTAAGTTTLTVSWTQVDDGTGSPAYYRVKYAPPSIQWSSATIGCARTIRGTEVGASISCTIEGLSAGTTYDVQLMSFRTDTNGAWVDAEYSNVATASTTATSPVQQTPADGIWISAAELARRPTSGPDWNRLLQDAAGDPGVADIGNQDSQHDVYTLAAALVCVRTGQYCEKARRGVLDAMYTEEDPSDRDGEPIPIARWMAVGRNLGAYVIAADLLDLRRGGSTGADGERVHTWLEGFLTKRLYDNNQNVRRGFEPFHSSANGAAQEGFAYAAVAAYLRDRQALDFVWEAFRTFVCDPGATDVVPINMVPPVRDGWTNPERPCAVNPKGSTMRVPSGRLGAGGTYRIDGSLPGDMRRGGAFQWEPGYTQYPWVGLEGLIPAAVILERAGYPAFAAADRAVLRTHEYLWWLRNRTGDARWFDGVRAREIVHLVNVVYGQSFPINQTIGRGRTVGYTGWTHADW